MVFIIKGISFVCGNESILETIKDSNVKNVRKVGYELCKNFINKDNSYFGNILKYIWDIELEEKISRDFLQDVNWQRTIFLGKASDNQIIKELQEGCFDYLEEEVLSDYTDFLKLYSRCIEIASSEKDLVVSEKYRRKFYNILNGVKSRKEKKGEEILYAYEFLVGLGLEDRLSEFEEKTKKIEKKIIQNLDDGNLGSIQGSLWDNSGRKKVERKIKKLKNDVDSGEEVEL